MTMIIALKSFWKTAVLFVYKEKRRREEKNCLSIQYSSILLNRHSSPLTSYILCSLTYTMIAYNRYAISYFSYFIFLLLRFSIFPYHFLFFCCVFFFNNFFLYFSEALHRVEPLFFFFFLCLNVEIPFLLSR